VLLLVGGSSIAVAQGNGNGNGNGNNGVGNGNGNGNGNGQDNGNPFHGKTDSGDDAHILPTPDVLLGTNGAKPSFAAKSGVGQASVFTASYGPNSITFHGGSQMPAASYVAVYWNTAVANSAEYSGTWGSVSAQITAFLSSFGSGVPDYSVIQQYGRGTTPIAATLPLTKTYVDTKANQSSITDSSIRSWLTGLFNGGKLTANANTLYGLYFPPGMKVNINASQPRAPISAAITAATPTTARPSNMPCIRI